MKSRLCSSVAGATFSVLKSSGATSATATIASVNSQYSGTTRTMRRRQNSAGPMPVADVVTTMMKPLMTKKRSTPEVPKTQGTIADMPLTWPAAWCQTTISAATPRRYWIGRITRDGDGSRLSDIAGILPQRFGRRRHGQSSQAAKPRVNQVGAVPSKYAQSVAHPGWRT